MFGQKYFEQRIGDIFHLSPIPYLCGDGELSNSHESCKVRWELNVPITGEPLLVISTGKVITPDSWITADRQFVEWILTGATDDKLFLIAAEAVILNRMKPSSDEQPNYYFSQFRQMDILRSSSKAVTKLEAITLNFTFEGTDKFQIAVAGRQIHFRQSKQYSELRELIKIKRIDRALISEIHVPLLEGETLEMGIEILFTLGWLISFLTLNRVSTPLLRLLDNETLCGWRIMELRSYPYHPSEIIDNKIIPEGIKKCLESVYDNFVRFSKSLELERLVDMILTAYQEGLVEFKVAGLILGYELFCTSFLKYKGRPLTLESNIEQKLNGVNSYLRFIPAHLLNERLRKDIRNPLFHEGLIIGIDTRSLFRWYKEYLDLLIEMLLFILGYKGNFISRVDYKPIPVPISAGKSNIP
ncbi:MAG: hypothetical protein NTX71_11455 [Candidatus Aureabacteria bacterium]|nr:hypothetical protein [Candidatus Auribacterota bacterium]